MKRIAAAAAKAFTSEASRRAFSLYLRGGLTAPFYSVSTFLSQSHFDLFGLQPVFDLDVETLHAAYREVQGRVHPDRHVAAGDAGKRVAMQLSARANEAFETLRSPLQRAIYLLEMRGQDIGAENNTAMEPAFLIQQMEWREAVEDARAAKNVDALDRLLADLRVDARQRYEKLGALLDANANQPAVEAVRQLMFLEKAQGEIGLCLAALEGA